MFQIIHRETSKARMRWIMVDVSAHSGGWVYGQPLPPLRDDHFLPTIIRNGSFQTASPQDSNVPVVIHHPLNYDQRPRSFCPSTASTVCCWSPWLLLSLLVRVFLRRISTRHRRPHDTKGSPEEEKIIPSTDSFSFSTFVSPGCQSFVPFRLQLSDQSHLVLILVATRFRLLLPTCL
ncbi:hypothetical protein BDW71DRAFT_94328 [Aspergillus fruticulosus]